jgi:hypothetical protein
MRSSFIAKTGFLIWFRFFIQNSIDTIGISVILRRVRNGRALMNTPLKVKERTPGWLPIVAEHVESLRFGVVQIVVHDNRVVQIEKTEKVRLDKSETQH